MEKTFDMRRKARRAISGGDASQAALLFRKLLRWGIAGFCGSICLMVFAHNSVFAAEPEYKPAIPVSQTIETGDAKKLGIKPLGVLLTAAGTMLEFRYIVTDPEKSHPIFEHRNKTYLVNQASGASFDVPSDTKLGPLRSSSRDPVAGKEYFIMFVNPGRVVKRGSKVTIVIGDFKIGNLTVD